MNNEQYLLICQIEEAAEVIQAACKGLRFGLDDHYENGETPRGKLTAELHDFTGVAQLLWGAKIVPDADDRACKAKAEKVRKFAQYSRDRGILDGERAAMNDLLAALRAVKALALPGATHIHKVCDDALARAEKEVA